MYQDSPHRRLTLYLQPKSANAGTVAFHYALSGNTGRKDMLRLATLVYERL
jgi:hypothetical protein